MCFQLACLSRKRCHFAGVLQQGMVRDADCQTDSNKKAVVFTKFSSNWAVHAGLRDIEISEDGRHRLI